MSFTEPHAQAPQTAGTRSDAPATPLLAIVGFDGKEPSRLALRAATQLIKGRDGHVEVVYVAHLPVDASLSAPVQSEIRQGFDDVERELSLEVRTLLDRVEQRWHFQRRDGAVAHELLTAAADLHQEYGDAAAVVIVVGSSVHKIHQVFGSVPVSLARQAKFAVLVVPCVPVST